MFVSGWLIGWFGDFVWLGWLGCLCFRLFWVGYLIWFLGWFYWFVWFLSCFRIVTLSILGLSAECFVGCWYWLIDFWWWIVGGDWGVCGLAIVVLLMCCWVWWWLVWFSFLFVLVCLCFLLWFACLDCFGFGGGVIVCVLDDYLMFVMLFMVCFTCWLCVGWMLFAGLVICCYEFAFFGVFVWLVVWLIALLRGFADLLINVYLCFGSRGVLVAFVVLGFV